MPVNNQWAAIGGVIVAILLIVLESLSRFFQTGQPWPSDLNGWLFVLVPGIVAGLVAMMTPHYSPTERRTGARVSRVWRGDAPVTTLERKDLSR